MPSRPRNSSNHRVAFSHTTIEKLEDRVMLTAGNGLQAQYFDTTNLSSPALVRIDPAINFDWGAGSPDAAIGDDLFSVRWSGEVESQFTETYSFILNANDGARLWVNGQLLIDEFESGSISDETASIDLIAGRRYDIQLEYRENTGNASVSLEWSSDSLDREVVPTDRLYASERGTITTQRWNGLNGSDVSDLTTDSDFPNSPSTATTLSSFESAGNAGANFGQRVVGYVHAPVSGPYTFFIAADESAELWLSNTNSESGKTLIASVESATGPREWNVHESQRSVVVYLAAGQEYFIEALHKEANGADHLAVGWIQPGTSSIEVISGEYLSPVRSTVEIFSDTPIVAEGSTVPARFTVTRTGPTTNALDVQFSTFGEAVEGVDFQTTTGNVTIPAGQTAVTLEINALVDTDNEGDESLNVELLAGSGYDVGLKSQRTAYGTLQDDAVAPAGGISLWNGDSLSDFDFFGGSFTTVSDPGFGNVIQAVIPGGLENSFNSQLRQGVNGSVSEGDILWVEFQARSVGGPGEVSAIFERSSAPYTKSLSQGISLSEDWSKIQIPFSALESYSSGEASFGFHLGHLEQTLQFTDFQVFNYGPPRSLSPETSFILNNIGGVWGSSQFVPVTGQSFTTAFEVDVATVPPQFWHIQTLDRNEGVVTNGDIMRVEFSLRATAGSNPETSLVVQRTDDYATLFTRNFQLSEQWQHFSFDIEANDDFGVDGLQAVFNAGFGIQTIEIGGFKWSNLSNTVDLEDLPSRFPSASYEGRGANEDWRESADQRIEDERKAPVTITVHDVNGVPLDGAVVSLRQNNHEFLFGSAINAFDSKLDPNGNETALKYQSEINRLFNAAVLENSAKWTSYLQDPARAQQGADFATDNGLYLRGHNLIWPSREFMPDSVWAEYDSRVVDDGTESANAWLTVTIEERFDEVLTAFDGQIPEWDVVNEPWSNHDVMDLLGDDIIVDWYQRVRDFDPGIKLVLNDFGIFASNGSATGHRDNFEYWLGLLNDEGLLDVIGEQSHYNDSNLTDIGVLGTLINDYNAQFDAPIAITEFDVNTKDETLQADYLRDYMTMAFSQSAVTEFLHWGFWESSHWLPDAALYRSDFSIKPNGQAYEDLVFGEWWTDVQGTTRDGAVTTDAFRGTYDVIVQYDGQTYNATVTVDDSGTSSVNIDLPVERLNHDPVINSDSSFVSGAVATELTNSGIWFEPDHQTLTLEASHGSVVLNSDGTWEWSYSPGQVYSGETVTITGTDSGGGSAEITFEISAVANVRSRGISYGDSSFTESTLDSNKTALLPGQTATFANYTSYDHGINRVVIEFAGLDSELSTNDFEFRVGNNSDPDSWQVLNDSSSIPLPTISTTPGDVPGVDQIVLTWPDNAIQNAWLQVTMRANAVTGLLSSDVFYFGNAIGDTGNSATDARVNASDIAGVRNNLSGFSTVGIDSRYDINRDGRVNSTDISIIRNNLSGFFGLNLITVPGNGNKNLSRFVSDFSDKLPSKSVSRNFVAVSQFEAARDSDRIAPVVAEPAKQIDMAFTLIDLDADDRRRKKGKSS